MQTVKDALGLSGKKVRYAVVGLGDISQRAFMPGVKHTGNSEITALVTGDAKKAEAVAKQYGLKPEDVYTYEHFGSLLVSGKIDAIYLGTPNHRHLEFVAPAFKAGIHVLLEKPMEINSQKCQEILAAQKASNGVKLMIAYRLHMEEGTITAIERVRSGELGDVHMFSSLFSQPLKPENHRAKNGPECGPLFDMGTYPCNAVRNLFGSEPEEVSAVGIRHPEAGFSSDFDDTVAVTLKFPGNKIAQFIVSYYGNLTDQYTVAGTKGSIHVSPGFLYEVPIEFNPYAVGEKKKHESFKLTDHFGGETHYFSECILNNTDVECDGEEGYLDVRVLEAALKSAQTKTPQKLEPYQRTKRIEKSQIRKLSPISPPKEIKAEPPAEPKA